MVQSQKGAANQGAADQGAANQSAVNQSAVDQGTANQIPVNPIPANRITANQGRAKSKVTQPLLLLSAVVMLSGGAAYALWRSQSAAPPVAAIAATQSPTVTALGYLEPQGEIIRLAAPSSAGGTSRVERLLVEQGEAVRAGQVIAVLDSSDRLQAALVEAQQGVKVARSNLAVVQAGARRGEVNAQQAEIARLAAARQGDLQAQVATVARLQAELQNAQAEAQRYELLYQQGAVSTSLRDTRRLTLASAERNLQQAEAVLAQIETTRSPELTAAAATLNQIAEVRPVDVAAAQARVDQAIAAVQQAQAQLDLAIVRSPQDGIVLEIHTRPGELIAAEGIVELGQTRQMAAVLEVYETDIVKVKLGQPVQLFADSFPEPLAGRVTQIGVQVKRQNVVNTDPSANIDARIVEVRVRLNATSAERVAGLTNLQVTGEIQQ